MEKQNNENLENVNSEEIIEETEINEENTNTEKLENKVDSNEIAHKPETAESNSAIQEVEAADGDSNAQDDEIASYDIDENKLDESKEETKEVENEHLTWKEKRKKRLRKIYFFETDIKYRGPLTYRYLRIIAWMSIALSQVIALNNLSAQIFGGAPLIGNMAAQYLLSFGAALSVPLFIIATFSTILNRSRSLKEVLIFYGGAFIAVALGIIILYYRYIDDILLKFGADHEAAKELADSLGTRLEVNVFADFFALSGFYFFMIYDPKRVFTGKKIYIFRSFAILPLGLALASYIIKLFAELGYYQIPFALNPFLATKPPLIYVLFILLTFWLKLRERQYIKLGGTKAGYLKFEKSNRNSLRFSIVVSVIMFILSIIDLGLLLWPIIAEDFGLLTKFMAIGIGNSTGLFIAIPFILLFSYTRTHKPSAADLLIVISGFAMIGLVYLEMIHAILTKLLA